MVFQSSSSEHCYHNRLDFVRELSSVAVFVHLLIPIVVVVAVVIVVVVEIFGYSLCRDFLLLLLVKVWVRVSVGFRVICVFRCDNLSVYACTHVSV